MNKEDALPWFGLAVLVIGLAAIGFYAHSNLKIVSNSDYETNIYVGGVSRETADFTFYGSISLTIAGMICSLVGAKFLI